MKSRTRFALLPACPNVHIEDAVAVARGFELWSAGLRKKALTG